MWFTCEGAARSLTLGVRLLRGRGIGVDVRPPPPPPPLTRRRGHLPLGGGSWGADGALCCGSRAGEAGGLRAFGIMPRNAFQLHKWYIDAVAADGTCVIGYWARCRWRGLRLRYASVLVSAPGEKPMTRSTLGNSAEPVYESGRICWRCPALDVKFELTSTAHAVSRQLLERDDGGVAWECRVPAGRARVEIGDRNFEGTGYGERLVMTVPPQRLPIRELRWGRFIGEDATASAVWIQWRGSQPLDLLLDHGADAANVEIGDERCSWSGEGGAARDLTMDRGRTIRDDVLGGAVLGAVPAVRRLARG